MVLVRGHGSYTGGAPEVLASLVAGGVFAEPREAAGGVASCSGTTESLGSSFIVNKVLTTKMPGAAGLMQLASAMAKEGLWLSRSWL